MASNNCRGPDAGDEVGSAGGGTKVLGSGWLNEVRPH